MRHIIISAFILISSNSFSNILKLKNSLLGMSAGTEYYVVDPNSGELSLIEKSGNFKIVSDCILKSDTFLDKGFYAIDDQSGDLNLIKNPQVFSKMKVASGCVIESGSRLYTVDRKTGETSPIKVDRKMQLIRFER